MTRKSTVSPVLRIFAAGIDLALIVLASGLVSFAVILQTGYSTDTVRFSVCQEERSRSFVGCDEYRRQFESANAYSALATLTIALLYLTGLPLIWGKTLGQAVMGIRLQPIHGKLTFSHMLLREVPLIIYLSLQALLVLLWIESDRTIREPPFASAFLLLGYAIAGTIYALRTPEGSFPHDILSGVRTVRISSAQ
ncbi:MAG: RDD family protein [Patescibacteria group bacterium]|nr:RDD family protein [Patescibacteria group bacterium]